MQQFETEQWVPFPRDLVFAFFANPRNLPPLMPGWQHARIDRATFRPAPPRPAGTPVYPGVTAGDGTRLLITARGLPLLPLRGSWDARIEDFHWNDHFCDVQLSGPFAYWRHCHTVRDAASPSNGRPGTTIHDHVTYALPLQPVTRLGAPAMQFGFGAMFGYRHRRTDELLPRFAAQAAAAAKA